MYNLYSSMQVTDIPYIAYVQLIYVGLTQARTNNNIKTSSINNIILIRYNTLV